FGPVFEEIAQAVNRRQRYHVDTWPAHRQGLFILGIVHAAHDGDLVEDLGVTAAKDRKVIAVGRRDSLSPGKVAVHDQIEGARFRNRRGYAGLVPHTTPERATCVMRANARNQTPCKTSLLNRTRCRSRASPEARAFKTSADISDQRGR